MLVFLLFFSSVFLTKSLEKPLMMRWSRGVLVHNVHLLRYAAFLVIQGPLRNDTSQVEQKFFKNMYPLARQIVYGSIDISQIRHLIDITNLKPPFVVCFKQGVIISVLKLPAEEDKILKQMQVIFFGPTGSAANVNELRTYLSHFDYTLISRHVKSRKAHVFIRNHIIQFGSCGFIQATKEVFDRIDASEYQFALYRNKDRIIVPISINKSSDIIEIGHFFDILTEGDFKDNLVVGIFDNHSEFNFQCHDTFQLILAYHPDVHIGFVTNRTYKFTHGLVDHKITKYPDIFIANYQKNLYYSTKLIDRVACVPRFTDQLLQTIVNIKNGVNKPTLKSELEEEPKANASVHKIVGSNFAKFVTDENAVSLVFFINSNYKQQEFKTFASVARELVANNTKNIKFAYFKTDSNYLEKYPKYYNNSFVHLYLHNINETIPMIDVHTRAGYLRFLALYQPELNIIPQKSPKQHIIKRMAEITDLLNQLSEEEREFFEEYNSKLNGALASPDLSVDDDTVDETNELYHPLIGEIVP